MKNLDTRWGAANIEKLFSFGEFNSLTWVFAIGSFWWMCLYMSQFDFISHNSNFCILSLTCYKTNHSNDIKSGEASNFKIWELLIFMITRSFGGLIGAVFNATNERITLWWMKNVNFSKKRCVVEVLCCSLLVSIVLYIIPMIWNRCTDQPTDM